MLLSPRVLFTKADPGSCSDISTHLINCPQRLLLMLLGGDPSKTQRRLLSEDALSQLVLRESSPFICLEEMLRQMVES